MSSSRGKIVIAPKKKKKNKPLIIVSKKKTVSSGAPNSNTTKLSADGRPASPNTVAAAATDANATLGSTGVSVGGSNVVNKQGKKSKSSIFIKPFEKPPELPHDFYESSLVVLRRALTCVLRHEALLAKPSGGKDGTQANDKSGERLIGREELYRSVEDLCVHKFGSKLYYDVVKIMEEAAAEVVSKLATLNSQSTDEEGNTYLAIVDSITGDVGYNAAQLINDLNLKDGGVGANASNLSMGGSSGEGETFTAKRYALLQRMDTVCRTSYAEEYLTFVRSIFLALDRAYVYYSDTELEEIGSGNDKQMQQLKQESADQLSPMDIDSPTASNSNTSPTRSPPSGKVMERSSTSSNNSRVWGLWEVGIACLRHHMVNAPTTSDALSSANSAEGSTLSVLTAMILTTAYAVLSEYDHNSSSFTSTYSAMGDSRPLIRNCVRTIIDLGSLPTLLEELIVVASARFEKEGVAWGMSLAEGKRSAPDFLLHVEHRLRQSNGLASYYLPGNSESVNALRRLSKLDHLTGVVPTSSTSNVSWSPVNNSTRRVLPAIIEKQLLGPHLVVPNAGILEPRHLYPMLDDDTGAGGDMAWKPHHSGASKTYENAKRLYGLCWRMMASTSSHVDSTAPLQPASSGVNKSSSTALDHLRLAFGEYGRLRGSEIVRQGMNNTANNSKEMEKKVIPDLLVFKNHLYSLLAIAFRGEKAFESMVRSVLDDVLNGAASGSSISNDEGDGGRRIAELLAKHVDLRFKDAKASASTASSTTAMAGAPNLIAATIASDANESFQNEILALFRHIHSKDVFEAFYKRDLAKRLLTGRAVSTDMERSFLTKLKTECGSNYTSKMEGMFKDMELSRDIMGSFAAYAKGAAAATDAMNKVVDMDVQVLTTGYWPVYPKYPNIIMPEELLAQRTKFETYYNDKYQGRRITWQYSLGNCIVKASFPKSPQPKELIVNMCQSLVLLCFKDGDGEDGKGFTLDEILKKTGIDDKAELERVLQSLSMGRDGTRVLRKVDWHSLTEQTTPIKPSPSGQDGGSPQKKKKIRVRRTVGPYDRFLVNASFTSNQRRIRITNITMKETSEERSKTHAAVSKDRLYFIDAAVVRIMKARKTLAHRDLIGEVMAQLKFPAAAADIKKRIESLIEREYMERVEGDRSKYKYLA